VAKVSSSVRLSSGFRTNRCIEGQARGLQRMVEEEQYCYLEDTLIPGLDR